ncbi:MAG: FecR family protein [Leptospirales bacterium]|nr:FecR family protein [Leptospirales bacterium]
MSASLLEKAPILRTLRPDRRDWYVIAICGALSLGAGIGLYLNSRSHGPGSGERVGTLIVRRNIAQRKYGSQAIWEALEDEVPIYNNDSIRTGDYSLAEIVLNDQTRIKVDENTMIVVSVGDRTNINFAYGSLQADRGAAGGGEVTIQSANQTVSVGSSDVQLARRDDQQALDVTVRSGQATVASADGQAQSLGAGQRATVSQGGAIEVRPIPFQLQNPPAGASFFVNEGGASLRFEWQGVSGEATLEVSQRRNFLRPDLRLSSSAGNAAASLGAGNYYWRIAARNVQNGQLEYSEVRRFSVLRNAPVRLQAPAAGRVFQYSAEAPFVNFAWSANDQAQEYVLEIAHDASFTNLVRSKNSPLTGLSLPVSAGDYYWRVRSLGRDEASNTSSAAQSFRVLRSERAPPPQPAQPTEGRNIPQAVASRGIVFTWRQSAELRETTLQISRSESFADLAASAAVHGSFTRLSQPLPPGAYFWRLRGRDAGGLETEFSSVARFAISAGGALRTQLPAEGAELSLDEIRADGCLFQWQRTEGGGRYVLRLSRSRDMRAPREESVSGASLRLNDLGEGQWYYQVALTDADEEILRSEVVAFRITDVPAAPEILAPAPDQNVNLADRDGLHLRWTAVRNATYYDVTLTQLGRRPRPALRTRVNGLEFQAPPSPELLSGDYSLSVRACRTAARNACSAEAVRRFQLSAPEELPPPEFISPPTQYVVPE